MRDNTALSWEPGLRHTDAPNTLMYVFVYTASSRTMSGRSGSSGGSIYSCIIILIVVVVVVVLAAVVLGEAVVIVGSVTLTVE